MKNKDNSSFATGLIISLLICTVIITVFANVFSDGEYALAASESDQISSSPVIRVDSTDDDNMSSSESDSTTESTASPDSSTETESSPQETTSEIETAPSETTTEKPTTTAPKETTTEKPTTTTPPETTTEKPTTTTPPETTTEKPTTTTPPETTTEQPTTATPPSSNPVMLFEINPEYDFSKQVPLTFPVEEDYFADAIFLGDSLTDGLALYSDLKNTTYYSKQSLSTSTAFTTPAVTVGDQTLSIIDAMKVTPFKKVYIMLGINEVGYPSTSSFTGRYGQIIDAVREVNPSAIIYIQPILPVTAERSETHKYIKNASIFSYNDALLQLANEKKVYFVNVAAALSDGTGALLPEASSDGVHLKASYYNVWYEYLKTHAIRPVPVQIPTGPS